MSHKCYICLANIKKDDLNDCESNKDRNGEIFYRHKLGTKNCKIKFQISRINRKK